MSLSSVGLVDDTFLIESLCYNLGQGFAGINSIVCIMGSSIFLEIPFWCNGTQSLWFGACPCCGG